MDKILTSVRSLLLDHLAASETLTQDLPLNGTVIKVPNNSRFRINDEIYIYSVSAGFAETSIIADMPDFQTIVIAPPTVRAFTVAEGTIVQKAVNNQLIKRIHIGDLKIIPSFPTITIDAASESNEWLTLDQTSHEYKFTIRTYILADEFEKSNIFLIKLSQQIREILIDHIRPIIDGESHPLLLDLPVNSSVVTIADTSNFKAGDPVFLRDAVPNPGPNGQEDYIKTVLSSTDLELRRATAYNYLVGRQAEIIKVKRLLYDSRPDSISYGYVQSPGGGSLMRASEISWFAKENLLRLGNILT